MHQKVKDRL